MYLDIRISWKFILIIMWSQTSYMSHIINNIFKYKSVSLVSYYKKYVYILQKLN